MEKVHCTFSDVAYFESYNMSVLLLFHVKPSY